MTTLSRKDWILLLLLTLCWGINWPIMKLGVRAFPPISFRVLCMAGGLPVIWLAARLQGASLAIPAGQLGAVTRLAVPNMLVWHTFMIVAVRMLSSGRAAILGYTMPVWAVLCGVLFFRDRPTRGAWFGIACALAGALLLLSSEFATLAGNPAGSLLALVAAAGWGYGTVQLKRTSLDMPTISLTFWMLAIATVIMAVIAVVAESSRWHVPDGITVASITYNAAVIFGFAHVVWFGLARSLPPVASSLSVMMIPVLGVFSGAWLLHETPHWQDYAAMALILVAMSSVLLKRPAGNRG
ncbi:DMT family transporter [Noviherbaspirillum galbum]|uniref:DMT family transporter n=1 Tax=Noviherbaspirillum galbum TaxID=2709383 RepID=A0A6B3SIA8_9BURK|nr:DMT family transporter [Noviherbaspirillum galbum]NEX60584.1 DMT family transporter [Noviherbaspirillum galbum]